ncbi:MAG: hypothetical protein QOH96_3017 [Blastocatellia bacterium]|jgi:hypothetical protein|nr:hypothetical protein [Blastocatellia bacterium]
MKYALILVVGLLLGGGAVFYFLVGAPRARTLPGVPIRPPDQSGGDPPGTAVVSFDEKFFDTILGTIFRDLQPPAFPLQLAASGPADSERPAQIMYAMFQGDCEDRVVLVPEGSGIVSGVHFTQGNIITPLAFTGSYNAPILGCLRFKGWARANMQLSFEQATQTVYGRINVEGVNLEGVEPGMNNAVTALVQKALNQRVNPLQILRAQQLTLAIPIQASNGTLKAQARDVRSEIQDGIIRLHITYDFSGVKNQ